MFFLVTMFPDAGASRGGSYEPRFNTSNNLPWRSPYSEGGAGDNGTFKSSVRHPGWMPRAERGGHERDRNVCQEANIKSDPLYILAQRSVLALGHYNIYTVIYIYTYLVINIIASGKRLGCAGTR